MLTANLKKYVCVSALLLLVGSTANATTLWVNCGAKSGLNSIGAALKALQSGDSHGLATINVSGACQENVVIQRMDRLTVNAVSPGTSITDRSGGTLDVINISDSQDVTISNFTIDAGADGVTGANGIVCGDGAMCRLTNDTVQGATDGAGIAVFTLSRARLTGVTLLNNGIGLQVINGASVVGDATMRGNNRGMHMVSGAVVNIGANITQSKELGVFGTTNATLNCLACVITGNAGGGVLLRQSSSARFTPGFTITNNGGPGVELTDLSSALFQGGTVTGNGGKNDVLCSPQYSVTRGTSDIGGGSTNCLEP
jgi:hypothetical protein